MLSCCCVEPPNIRNISNLVKCWVCQTLNSRTSFVKRNQQASPWSMAIEYQWQNIPDFLITGFRKANNGFYTRSDLIMIIYTFSFSRRLLGRRRNYKITHFLCPLSNCKFAMNRTRQIDLTDLLKHSHQTHGSIHYGQRLMELYGYTKS